MKKQITILSCLFMAGIFITSCKKDDITKPVVTINGSDMTISLQGTYSDPGATANDNKDGKLSPQTSGSVNTNLKGVYEITYTATDAAGNSGTATRKVTVINDMDGMNGTYNVTGTPGPYTYTQTVTASATLNKRIIFGKLGDYAGNTSIYADVVGTTINLPSQTATQVGNPPVDRTSAGTGTTSATSFTVAYSETASSITSNFTEVMVKQ